MNPKWSDEAWQSAEIVFQKIIHHPFVVELAAGTLSRERFGYYLNQDAIYLGHYAKNIRLLSYMIECSDDPLLEGVKPLFSKIANEALAGEEELHSSLFERFGIERDIATPQNSASEGYVDFVATAIYTCRVEWALAATLPCFWIYNRVGQHILSLSQASIEKNPYREWILSYAGEDFERCVEQLVELADQFFDNLNKAEHKALIDIFLAGCAFEYRFWDSAYNLGEENL